MLKNLFFLLLILTSAQLFNSCSGCSENKTKDGNSLALPDSLNSDVPLKLSEDIMSEVIQNISSPLKWPT
jgi:hypothetical protein